MFEALKTRKNEIFLKILLVLISLSFIVFFGTGNLQQNGQKIQNVEYKDIVVPGKKINYVASRVFEFQKSQATQTYPQEFVDKLYSPERYQNHFAQTQNQFLAQAKMKSKIADLGFKITPQDIGAVIYNVLVQNPFLPQRAEAWILQSGFFSYVFDKDFKMPKEMPKFDAKVYKKQIKPWYKRTLGSDVENDLSQKLLEAKFLGSFANLYHAENSELDKFYAIQNTKYSFEVIKIAKTMTLPNSDKKAKKTDVKNNTDLKPIQIAQNIYKDWQAKKDIKKDLNLFKIKMVKKPNLVLGRLKTLIDDEENIALFKSLLKLTEKKPFLQKPFQSEDFIYLIKLTKKEMPEALTQKSREDFQKRFEQFKENQIFASWFNSLK